MLPINHIFFISLLLISSRTFETTFDFFGKKLEITAQYEKLDNESSFVKSYKSLVPRTVDEIRDIHSTLTFIAEKLNLDDYGKMFLYIKFIQSIPLEKSKKFYSLPEVLEKKKITLPSGIILLSALLWNDRIENIILESEDSVLLGIPLNGVGDLPGYLIEKGKRYYLKDISMLPPGELKVNINMKKGFKITEFNINGGPLSINLERGLPHIPEGKKLIRKFGFVYNDKYYRFNTVLDSNLIEYSDILPADFTIKTKFGILEMEQAGITKQLKSFIEKSNFTILEKINFLLSMISQLFNYRESEVKGVSRNLLELANDCDARSTFFASLLFSVLDYSAEDIVFIEFPGAEHACVGVHIKTENPADVEGTYITYKGKKYWICDTTYLIDGTARIGLLHPDYEGKEITVHPLR